MLPLSDLGYLPILRFAQNGGRRWNRTTDTGIFNPLLYRLSYLGNVVLGNYGGRVLNLWRARRSRQIRRAFDHGLWLSRLCPLFIVAVVRS